MFNKKCNMVNSSRHSIFNKKSIDEINSLTGYTFHYLVDIKEGRKKETAQLKTMFDLVLRCDELESINSNKDVRIADLETQLEMDRISHGA